MDQKHLIKSVFKNETPTKKDYTRIWIELISSLELSKIGAPVKNHQT